MQQIVSAEDLRRGVAGVSWFHRIDLGQGIVTPGIDASQRKLRGIGLPADLSGKSVLDIGSWDGFFAFEAERRGAARVLATDSYCWSGDGWGSKAGFELARRALGSRVEDREIDVMDLSPETVGSFDVVLCLGVLYHIRHPLLMLDRVASVTGEMLILETSADLLGQGRPTMAFYEGEGLNGDPTNWWGPNAAALCAMLRSVGFKRVEVHSAPSLGYRLARALRYAPHGPSAMREKLQQGRVAVHAWR